MQAAVGFRCGLPAVQAHHVELRIFRVKLPRAGTRQEPQRQLGHSALHHVAEFLPQQHVGFAPAVAEVQRQPGERTPTGIVGNPDLAARRVVDFARQPAEWFIVSLRRNLAVVCPHVAVKAALLVLVDPRRRHPVAFLIRTRDDARRRNPEADRVTKPRRVHFRFTAILEDAHQAATRRRVGIAGLVEKEVSLRIGFQTRVVRVFATGAVPVVVHALVEVCFAIVVVIVQSRELPAFEHVNFPVDHLQTHRLIQPRGEPLPVAFVHRFIDAHEPDIAVSGGHRDAAIGQEIDRRAEEQRLERVVVGYRQRVDGKRPNGSATNQLRDEGLAPTEAGGFGELAKVLE